MKETLLDCFLEQKNNDKRGIIFKTTPDAAAHFMSYKRLFCNASILANQLLTRKEKTCFLRVNDNRLFVISFWACQILGITPAIISNEAQMLNLKSSKMENSFLLFDKRDSNQELPIPSVRVSLEDFENTNWILKKLDASHQNKIALIQFSSGSTGEPKGVKITQQNIIAEYGAYDKHFIYNDKDVFGNWLPLSHNYGLIFHLIPLMRGLNQVLIQTQVMLKRPLIWLNLIEKYKVTATSSNTEMLTILSYLAGQDKQFHSDLSSLRLLCVGGGNVQASDLKNFTDTFAPYALKVGVLGPGYGLTETTLSICTKLINYKPEKVLGIDKNAIGISDTVKIGRTVKNMLSIVSNGPLLPGIKARIVNEKNVILKDEKIGFIQVKSKTTTPGYFHDKENSESLYTEDNWLRTGDLGFFYENELYVLGRAQDMITLNGKNIYLTDIQQHIVDKHFVENESISVGVDADHTSLICFLKQTHGLSKEKAQIAVNNIERFMNNEYGISITTYLMVTDFPTSDIGKVQTYKLIELLHQKKGSFIKP